MTAAEDPRAELLRLRSSIDNIDAALIFMLAERFRATQQVGQLKACLLYTSPSPRDKRQSRMPSSA